MKTQQAIAIAGSVRELAKALDISPQAIYLWGDEVPPLRVYQLREIYEIPDSDYVAGSLRKPTTDDL